MTPHKTRLEEVREMHTALMSSDTDTAFLLSHIARLEKALEVADKSLTKIMSGMTTDINRVEEDTKREAHEAKQEIAQILTEGEK